MNVASDCAKDATEGRGCGDKTRPVEGKEQVEIKVSDDRRLVQIREVLQRARQGEAAALQ